MDSEHEDAPVGADSAPDLDTSIPLSSNGGIEEEQSSSSSSSAVSGSGRKGTRKQPNPKRKADVAAPGG